MDCWVDLDSGTYGAAEPLVFIYLDPEQEEAFSEWSDNKRCYVAERMARYGNTFESAVDLWDSP